MDDALFYHRLQFAFTIVYHYLFPQLTMGLALLIVVMKAMGLRENGERWNDAARFWIRIFGINFAVGAVTGIPMEFVTAYTGGGDAASLRIALRWFLLGAPLVLLYLGIVLRVYRGPAAAS